MLKPKWKKRRRVTEIIKTEDVTKFEDGSESAAVGHRNYELQKAEICIIDHG
jgi:hypothetical protein